MIPNETTQITINRDTWDRKANDILKALAYTIKNEYEFVDDKEIVTECFNIKINSINVCGDSFSATSRYINIGFLKKEKKTVTYKKDNKEENREYTVFNIDKTGRIEGYDTLKTLSFTQEIGTSDKYIRTHIYITDSYDKIKEKIKEIK